MKPEQYWEELLILVKKELDLYTKYAVRTRADGGIRHIYNTKIFKEELENILEDEFQDTDWEGYQIKRKALFLEWRDFHDNAYLDLKKGEILPLAYLMHKFSLTSFERYCVCLAAAPELNRELERMFCYLQDDYKFNYPTLDLCLKMYTMDSLIQKKLLHATASRKKLLQCIFRQTQEPSGSGLSGKLQLRANIREYMFFYEGDLYDRKPWYELYVPGAEEEAKADVQVPENNGSVLNSQVEAGILQCLGQETEDGRQLLFLKGAEGSGRKRQVKRAARARGKTVLFLDLKEIQKQSGEQKKERIRDAVGRALLNQSYLCCCHWETLCQEESWDREALYELLGCSSLFFSTVFVISKTDYPSTEPLFGFKEIRQFEVQSPTARQRIRLWRQFLADMELEGAFSLEALAAQFDFTPGMMKEAAKAARQKASAQGRKGLPLAFLYEACQQKISHRLGERADRVNAAYTWEDLILEKEPKELLKQACSQISFRYQVYEEWGFRQKMAYGRGVTMLFLGPPGTGKTMAAQVLANELNLELYKVDLSGVLSKYIGETQKNLKEIFDEVQKSRSILFFDEADALFGKRVNVNDARDISANAQTAYLLQKMEEYDGITILATNLIQNFDDAYKRRMKYMISFSLPKIRERRKLWKQVFPEKMPLGEDLDLEYLASNFELSGASIKNIALNAAFLAASRQETTGMEHIMISLQQEYQKAGKILGKEELKEYYIYKKQER